MAKHVYGETVLASLLKGLASNGTVEGYMAEMQKFAKIKRMFLGAKFSQ